MYIIILQGAYVGAFVGFVLTITIAIGGMIYPPDKMAGSISIKECDLESYNSTTSANRTVDGLMSTTFVPHRYRLTTFANCYVCMLM
jgi:hypothetical protein